MWRIIQQVRYITKHSKAPLPKKNKNIIPVEKVPIFNITNRDVKARVRTSTKPPQKVNVRKPDPNWIPLITCKRPEFNIYKHQLVKSNAKMDSIPLASSGWQHHKSKNDFFLLHPTEHKVNMDVQQPFATMNLNPTLLENLKIQLGVDKMSYIQEKAIPTISSGRHTLIAAETGCGKTVAYLVPIIMEILRQKQLESTESTDRPHLNSPRVIILTPGRELAIQIGEVIEKLTQSLNIHYTVITGGATKRLTMNPEFRNIDILVGSIGATSKIITNKLQRLHRVRQIVLDEADTLFDESFSQSLEYLMRRFGLWQNVERIENGPSSQLIMASATLPSNTYDMLAMFIDPETVQEVVSPNMHQLLPQIHQKFIRMRKSNRPLELLQIVKSEVAKHRPVVVFGNKSTTSDFISIFLNDNGIGCAALNGDMLHKIRVGQFAKFQNGEVNVLSTTDVASRGLDTTRACHVINYDFPYHISDYLHRIGRIGRISSNHNGYVTNFVSSLREVISVREIEHIARTKGTFLNVNNNFTRKIRVEQKTPEVTENMSENIITF